MANQVISMQQVRSVIQLLEKGFSLRAIASELSISRQSVTLYASKLHNSSYSFEQLRQLSDAELAAIVYTTAVSTSADNTSMRRKDFNALVPYFITELKRTGVTRQLLWQQYSKEHEDHFRYTQFCILLKEAFRPTLASMHLVHSPGAMVMVDFAGDKISYIDRSTGELVFCPVFVCVLPFSKYTYAMALPDATIPSVINALNGCMYYLGGVPLSLKTDNMKQIVSKSCRYEPVFSEALQQWATHYNITLLATRVAKPKDKGAVENEVKIAYQRIYAPLRDQQFFDINELNLGIARQLKIHNGKLFQLKDHSRLQQFEQEENNYYSHCHSIPL
jgi:transposase